MGFLDGLMGRRKPARPNLDALFAIPSAAVAGPDFDREVRPLLAAHCLACHGVDKKIVGPGMTEVAKKYAGRGDGQAYLAQKIKAGGSGVWGSIPMPPQSISDADAGAIAKWLAEGAKR